MLIKSAIDTFIHNTLAHHLPICVNSKKKKKYSKRQENVTHIPNLCLFLCPLWCGLDEAVETALPCSASKCLSEVSDWTLAVGAVLETLMQHQKCSHHEEGGGWDAEAREVETPHVSGWSDAEPKFQFPNI